MTEIVRLVEWVMSSYILVLTSAAPQITQQTLSTSCTGSACHDLQVQEWRTSRHAVAFTNGLFRFEFDADRKAWCASCHAPSAGDPRTVRDDDPVALEGISCVACHLNATGQLVAASKSPASPHDTLVDRSFASEASCAKCHEFQFPKIARDGMATGYYPEPMQATISEFLASPQARKGVTCADCHMKTPGRHQFLGSYNLEMLKRAVDFKACTTNRSLHVTLHNKRAAHNVPTGGVNRHIVLRAWRSSSPSHLQEFVLGRVFARNTDNPSKHLEQDTTLAAGQSRKYKIPIRKLSGSANEPINVELRYIYPLEEFAELPPGTRRTTVMYHVRAKSSQMPCN